MSGSISYYSLFWKKMTVATHPTPKSGCNKKGGECIYQPEASQLLHLSFSGLLVYMGITQYPFFHLFRNCFGIHRGGSPGTQSRLMYSIYLKSFEV